MLKHEIKRKITYIEEDKFSAYTDRDGRIAEAGWTYRNITRTMADMLPFTLGIIHAGRKGDARGIKNAYKKFTGGTLDDMAMKWNITKRTYSLTIYDNYQEAKKLGLNDMQALEYATFMSSATAPALLWSVSTSSTNLGDIGWITILPFSKVSTISPTKSRH